MPSARDASDVMEFARALYGESTPVPAGVVHVVSAVRNEGRLHVLAIGEAAPKSDTDFFVLQLARARADAVLTSAEILRREPELTLDFAGPWASALTAYRRDVLGKRAALVCAVLTRRGVPLDHPLWSDASHKLVLTVPERASSLRDELGRRAEVVGEAELTPRRALELLRARGYAALSVEAGPTVAGTLYDAPSVPDELWLSIAEIEGVPRDAVGKPLPPDPLLFADRVCVSDTLRAEQSGPWRFQRWRRAPR